MKVNISNLSQGTHEYELSKSVVDLGLEKNFTGDVAARVTLQKSSRQILLRVGVSTDANFQCDRCLDEFKQQVTPAFRILYVWDREEKRASPDDDVRFLAADTNIIDISGDVRDAVVIAVPLKLLCNEDCAGLCPKCGRNLNHIAGGRCDCAADESDPRWNKLSALAGVSTVTKKN